MRRHRRPAGPGARAPPFAWFPSCGIFLDQSLSSSLLRLNGGEEKVRAGTAGRVQAGGGGEVDVGAT